MSYTTVQPTLSIITPVLNGADFIISCIENVIQQDCPEAEHLIIDGGSDDGTLDIVKSYAARFNHIRWLSEKDNGQSDAMNKGIRMARGKIISFLNDDDYYEPAVLRRVLSIFPSLPEPGLLVANCNVRDEGGHIKFVNTPNRLKFTDLLMGDMGRFPWNPSAYFYHRSLHDRVGLYDTNLHMHMDIDFLLRAVQAAHVRYVNETWGNYRCIPGTKTYSLIQAGQRSETETRLIEHYRKQLPPLSATEPAAGQNIVPINIITPTHSRPGRLEYMTRMCETLKKLPAIRWIVIEDGEETNRAIQRLLAIQRINHVYLAVGPSQDKGNTPRNLGIHYLRAKKLDGVVYFADDDNAYDRRLFAEIRKTRRVSVFPVGHLGPNGIERPVVRGGKITEWDAGWLERKFPVDMAGFAIHSRLFHQKPDTVWFYNVDGGETELMEMFIDSQAELETLCQDCKNCYVWHNHPLRQPLPKTRFSLPLPGLFRSIPKAFTFR